MAASAYPFGIKVFVDGIDITKYAFGVDEIVVTDTLKDWRDIDITPYVKYNGLHKLKITCVSGVGRAEARVAVR